MNAEAVTRGRAWPAALAPRAAGQASLAFFLLLVPSCAPAQSLL